MTRGSLPVVAVTDLEEPSDRDGRVAGVVLAAGTGSRFEAGNKLLATVDGEPLVVRAARTLLEAGLDPVVAVVGAEAERVRSALAPVPVRVVTNPDYASGQASSVRVGVEALPEDVAAAVIALGDMPAVAPESVARLVTAYFAGAGQPLAAAYEGERGNPVLFDRRTFPALRRLGGDSGGRSVLLESPDAALVETGDPGVRHDVDTTDDLRECRSPWR